MLSEALPFIHKYLEAIIRRGIAIKQAILYGSVLSGSYSEESDIDMKISVRYKSDIRKILIIEKEINKDILKDGYKFYISTQIGTDVDFGNIGECVLLWGSPIKISTKKENLVKKHVITYSTDKLKQVKRAELSRRLLGYRIGDKYSFDGILKDTDSKRLRNAIVTDYPADILRILKEYDIPIESSTIHMSRFSKFVEKG